MHFNAGRRDDARQLAEQFCEVFEPYDTIVCPSGSCTSMVRYHYGALVPHSTVPSRVFELCEFLVNIAGVTDFGAELSCTAVLHVGCHARRMLDTTDAAYRLLSQVRGLRVIARESDSWCCGFGGTFAVKYPEISTAIGMRKLRNIALQPPDCLISTDSSCSMQLDGLMHGHSNHGTSNPLPDLPIHHIAQVLALQLPDDFSSVFHQLHEGRADAKSGGTGQ